MRKIIFPIAVALMVCACSDQVSETLGLTKQAPDEFSVVTRAPLSVPPNYALRPPRPGASRPMEISTRETARKTIFGVDDVKKDAGASVEIKNDNADGFLNKIGVSASDPNIRNTIDTEDPVDTRTTAQKLLGLDKDVNSDNTLDPKEELDRLKEEGVVTIKKRNEDIAAP